VGHTQTREELRATEDEKNLRRRFLNNIGQISPFRSMSRSILFDLEDTRWADVGGKCRNETLLIHQDGLRRAYLYSAFNLRDVRNNLAHGQLLVDHLDHLHCSRWLQVRERGIAHLGLSRKG